MCLTFCGSNDDVRTCTTEELTIEICEGNNRKRIFGRSRYRTTI